ncbi:hypothetical protein KDH_02420 [Dictyobacter sp. S3.2.2.5]|uniref:Uncharacterized protein n=1 Tax=Dictyobacter halimunensis TaxID=3026934 RepID=A0ABQ6FH95_9CHLR|nr:hypothetical protein KDH_02420 [Dictyobacter sp. S3.2.2.5]
MCQEKSSHDRAKCHATGAACHHQADAMRSLLTGHDIREHSHHGWHNTYAGDGLEKPQADVCPSGMNTEKSYIRDNQPDKAKQ